MPCLVVAHVALQQMRRRDNQGTAGEALTSKEIPESSGRPGPGDTRIPAGFMALISSTVFSSFLNTMYLSRRGPMGCGRQHIAQRAIPSKRNRQQMRRLRALPPHLQPKLPRYCIVARITKVRGIKRGR